MNLFAYPVVRAFGKLSFVVACIPTFHIILHHISHLVLQIRTQSSGQVRHKP